MQVKQNAPATGIPTGPGADSGLYHPGDAVNTATSAAEEVSLPLPIISEHAVTLGTAAATAITPAFEDELDGEGTAIDGAAKGLATPPKSGWVATLLRRVTLSRDGRPARRHYPVLLDREFMEDSRMAREMFRL